MKTITADGFPRRVSTQSFVLRDPAWEYDGSIQREVLQNCKFNQTLETDR